jgi:two-component system response regulator
MLRQGVILLVEDNPDDEALTRRALEKNGIVNPLMTARDGVEALDYLFGRGDHNGRSTDGDPSLVLLDLNLPRLDGHGVLREMRAHPRTMLTPVVVLTTSVHDADITLAYQLGCNSYIRKPVDFREFTHTIQRLCGYWLRLNQTPPRKD